MFSNLLPVLQVLRGWRIYTSDNELCLQLGERAYWSQERAWLMRKPTDDDSCEQVEVERGECVRRRSVYTCATKCIGRNEEYGQQQSAEAMKKCIYNEVHEVQASA